MSEPVLRFEAVHFQTEEGRHLLQGFDWTLEAGAKINLAAGARVETTTVLRLAAGVLHPQSGSVLLDGVPLGPYAFDHPFLKRGALGWVPRDGGLLANQTLLANVALPLMFTRRMDRAAAETRAAASLQKAGLLGAAKRRPHALDVRERWLGAVARAEAAGPELWLVEEPATSLDHDSKEAARALLDAAAGGTGAMIVIGDADWVPRHAMQSLRWVGGRMVPGDA